MQDSVADNVQQGDKTIMLNRRKILLERYEQVSADLDTQEAQVQELSQKFTDILDKVTQTRNFEMERDYQVTLKRLEDTREQNGEEAAKVVVLTEKLNKMKTMKKAMIAAEL